MSEQQSKLPDVTKFNMGEIIDLSDPKIIESLRKLIALTKKNNDPISAFSNKV